MNGVEKYWITIHQNVLGTCELAQNVRSNILLLTVYDLLIIVGIICLKNREKQEKNVIFHDVFMKYFKKFSIYQC